MFDNPAYNPNNPDTSNFAWLMGQIVEIVSLLSIVVLALAFIFITWRIITGFVLNGGDRMKVEEAQKSIGFAFLVLIVMAAVWGIVALLQSSLF